MLTIKEPIYIMLLILMNVNIFEWFLNKNQEPFSCYTS